MRAVAPSALARRIVAVALVVALPVTEARASPAEGEAPVKEVIAPESGAGEAPPVEAEVAPPPVEAGPVEAAPAEVAPVPEGPVDAGVPAPAPVSAPAAPEPAKGLVLTIVGAAVFGAVGVPLTFVGIWSSVVARSYGLHGKTGPTLAVFGVLGLGAGATLFGLGLARRIRWRRWRATQPEELSLGVGRSPLGTVLPGLTLRF